MKTIFRSLLIFLAIACFGVTAYSEQAVHTADTASYEVSQPYPDWENPVDRLPYAMMSYFAEVAKIKGRKPNKQKAIDQRLAFLASNGYIPAEKEDLPEEWYRYFQGDDLKRIHIDDTGFRARVFINKTKKVVALAIAGTDFSDIDSILSAAYLAYGKHSGAMMNGMDLAHDLRQMYFGKGYRIEITGASQGGIIAQLAAYATNASAFVFNSQMPGQALLDIVMSDAKVNIKHAYIEGDMLNDSIHPAGFFFQNSSTVETLEIMIDDDMEDELNNVYYKQHGVFGYYFATTPWIRHWTGTVLFVSEKLAGKNFADLYAEETGKKSAR
ncbi:hypothetical protein [Endozoicomonas lisbonensis]|uniref:Fungal lipase-like domain-containing protein n=1 Tax=Endozoicomonas lisbonensis TaxID=3120522 RepID=A0ABV2SH84_9GAMM